MSVLPYQKILDRCGLAVTDSEEKTTETGIIKHCLKKNVRSAGYDLRMGDNYYLYDEKMNLTRVGTRPLTEREPTVEIGSNSVIIVEILEELDLAGDDLVGHVSLKLDLLLKGLIMSSQSQIDAGYKGHVFALLYNLSHQPVKLSRGQSLLRLEFVKLEQKTEKPYPKPGVADNFAGKHLAQALTGHLRSSLTEMRTKVEEADVRVTAAERQLQEQMKAARDKIHEAEDKISTTQLWVSIVALVLTIGGAVISAYQGKDIARLEARAESAEKELQRVAPHGQDILKLEMEQSTLTAGQSMIETAMKGKPDQQDVVDLQKKVDALKADRSSFDAMRDDIQELRRQITELQGKK